MGSSCFHCAAWRNKGPAGGGSASCGRMEHWIAMRKRRSDRLTINLARLGVPFRAFPNETPEIAFRRTKPGFPRRDARAPLAYHGKFGGA